MGIYGYPTDPRSKAPLVQYWLKKKESQIEIARREKEIEIAKEANNFVTRKLWNNSEIGNKFNTPLLKDKFMFGFSDKKRLYCLNATTGEITWNDNAVNSDFASIVDCGTLLIGLASTGNLIVFKPDSKELSCRVVPRVACSSTPASPPSPSGTTAPPAN